MMASAARTEVASFGEVSPAEAYQVVAALRAAGLLRRVSAFHVIELDLPEGGQFEPCKDGFLLGDGSFGEDAARQVSAALSAARLRHRIEVYSDDPACSRDMIAYFHCDWPYQEAN